MNRTAIATVTIIAVAAVAIFGLRTYTQATTAPSPVTVHDADVNWDKHINVADLGLVASKYGQAVPAGGRPVAEQNLDGNGNIKVAQQGVVDVNVVSPGTQGRIIPLFENVTWNYSSPPALVFVDVRDCGHLDGFLKVGGGQSPSLQIFAALDTVDTFSDIRLIGGGVLGQNSGGPYYSGRFGFGDDYWGVEPPYVAARIAGGSQSFPTSTGSAWLYCTN